MTYEEKVKKFISKNTREYFKEKTPFDDLPLQLKYGLSTHHPERKGGMTGSSNLKLIK